MISKRVAVVLAISASALVGCGTSEPVVKYRTSYIAPPAALMQKGAVEPPPNVETYAKASWGLKETLLINMNSRQLRNLQACYRDKDAMAKWREEHDALYGATDGDQNNAGRANP